MHATQALKSEVKEDVIRLEPCSAQAVRRVAAMLDLDPESFREGAPLPRGWHFVMLGGETRRSGLRADGFPGFGLPMPDLGLPRLLLGGRSVTFHADLVIGDLTERRSRLLRLERKEGPGGPMAVMTLQHELRQGQQAQPAIVETQTYLLMQAARFSEPTLSGTMEGLPEAELTVVPDETLLFQYSALGFNTHRIHFDRHYAQTVEGFPDLVVNGGLVTLLATECLRLRNGPTLKAFRTRHLLPLFCGRPITFAAHIRDGVASVAALNAPGQTAMTLEGDVL